MTTATKITLFRVVMIPVFLVCMYLSEIWSWMQIVSCVVFAVASLSDILDGQIARRCNQVTDLGKFLDPLADKVLVIAAMAMFCEWGIYPAWALMIVLAREFAVTGLRLIAAGKGRVIAAGWSGKVKTAVTMTGLSFMLVFGRRFVFSEVLDWVVVAAITVTTLYSGIDADGIPTADYFPDLYEIAIGESNTPITALVRHYARMIAFKSGSAWSVQYGTMTLDSSMTVAAFNVTPLNRSIGNEALGQAQLLENNPLTLETGGVYQWQATSSSGYITDNQTNAKRVSDRVFETVKGFAPEKTRTFNRKNEHEFWFLSEGTALILNYASDAWYIYTNMPFLAMLDIKGEAYGFTADGKIKHLSRAYRNDDGAEIDAYAATGLMDFGRDWQLKYSPMIFVAIEPETNARVTVTAESNRRSDYPEKVVAMSIATFTHVDFNHFSFRTNHKAQVKRLKLKVKKAVFYRLVFKSVSASATATVLETDIQLRYAGNVK